MNTQVKIGDSSCTCHIVNAVCTPLDACPTQRNGEQACGRLCTCGPTCPGMDCACGCSCCG